jgi:hypothetical protein
MKCFSFLSLLAGLFFLVGCVSQPIEDERHSPSLMISQNSDGEATLLWQSDSAYVYTVVYSDKENRSWRTLRGANKLSGTGKMLEVKDQVNPRRLQRRYRLQFDLKD